MRCFIAIELDKTIRDFLDRLQNRLRAELPRDSSIKWVPPGNIHLTLKFLGEVPDNLLTELCSTLSRIATSHESFSIEIGDCGCFPPQGPARVLWLGLVEPTESLKKLQKEIENGLGPLGFPPENRGFSPHLTLARIKSLQAGRTVQSYLENLQKPPLIAKPPGQEVTSVTLFQSQLTPSGPIYAPIHHVNLV